VHFIPVRLQVVYYAYAHLSSFILPGGNDIIVFFSPFGVACRQACLGGSFSMGKLTAPV
jgi:hypothetical protein